MTLERRVPTDAPGMLRRMPAPWTPERITDELTTLVAALGHFPTRPELVARGQRNLWDAMRRNGGVAEWLARFGDAAVQPADEHIAVAAYYRHLAGGLDPVSDWLSAEADLRAAA